jgi:phosphonate transport system permease protein
MSACCDAPDCPPSATRPGARACSGRWPALALLWPMGNADRVQTLAAGRPGALTPALHFVAGFFPPRRMPSFLTLVAQETWRTVAMATAGLTLALVLAMPLALLSVRVLSLSA